MSEYHVPVLLHEVLDFLKIERGGIYLDATLGGGGHTLAILQKLRECGGGSLFSIDQDPEAIAEATKAIDAGGVLQGEAGKRVSFKILRGNFSNMKELLAQDGIFRINGILMDLGVSSHQLDAPWRGFSFRYDGNLDMRMSDSEEVASAADLVNSASYEDLYRIISDYGEERFAGRIARAIVAERELKPIATTFELANLISHVVPTPRASSHGKGKAIHPATRTFQALRIAVNDELTVLEEGVHAAIGLLDAGGRIAVISYHSLEDRIVKTAIKQCLGHCTCPPLAPICTCGAKATLKEITKRPVAPSDEELKLNPRSRSAKLRVAERLQ